MANEYLCDFENICDFENLGCLLCCQEVEMTCSVTEEDTTITVFEHRIGGVIKHEFDFLEGERIKFDNVFAEGVNVKIYFEYKEDIYAFSFFNKICA